MVDGREIEYRCDYRSGKKLKEGNFLEVKVREFFKEGGILVLKI